MSVRIPILNGFQVRYKTTNACLQQQLAESKGEYGLAKSNLDRTTVNLIQVRYEGLLRDKIVEFYKRGEL